MALAIQYAAGQKSYTAEGSEAKNNVAGAALLAKTRKMAGHFRHSGKATDSLDRIQRTLITANPPVFPYDRPAKSLMPKKRQ